MTDILIDPQKIGELNKEGLLNLWEATSIMADELSNQLAAIKAELEAKIEGNGEIIGKFAITRAKRIKFTLDIKKEVDRAKAEELGALREVVEIDTKYLKELFNRGIEIPHETTEYLMIKEVVKKKAEDK